MYAIKVIAVWTAIFVVGFAVALAVSFAMAFGMFGAYMPDGFSLFGYVYGVTDAEMIAMGLASAVGFCVVMFGGVAFLESKVSFQS